MLRTFTYIISKDDEGNTIETFLRKRHYSGKLITRLTQTEKGICLSETAVYKTRRLKDGDQLVIRIRDDAPSRNIIPEPVPLSVLYEDEDILVIDKAAGMPIHSSMGHHTGTVANGLAHYLYNAKDPYVCRIINRLDRDTSGLLIAAKHLLASGILSQMMTDRAISRTYLALAKGLVPLRGTVRAPIARAKESILERCVDEAEGKAAVTHYQRIAYDGTLSLIMLKLETGRTHQIRVHMKHLGNPLPGDFIYCPDYSRIKRQALHAYRLEFLHPMKAHPICLTAPIPEDFRRAFQAEIPSIPPFWM